MRFWIFSTAIIILSVMTTLKTGNVQAGETGKLTVRSIGQSCYFIVAPDGTRIVTDPYGSFPPLPFPDVEADLITISHEHVDHNADYRVGGDPVVLRTPSVQKVGMVEVKGYPSLHPEYQGAQCRNVIFVYTIGDFKIVHLGELGEPPSAEVTKAIQDADVLFFCIGFSDSLSTLKTINEYIQTLHAKVIVPGHYSLSPDKRWFGMATVDEYLGILPKDTKIVHSNELTVQHGMEPQVAVLERGKF